MAWITVRKGGDITQCPVCGKPDWCGVTSDGNFAHCMRIESKKPTKKGGWLHKLGKDIKLPDKKLVVKQKPKPNIDWQALSRRYFEAVKDHQILADELGVSAYSLQRLGAGYDGKAWCFPMRDGKNKIIGISRRTKPKKCCVKGSSIGLFIPGGTVPKSKETLYIVEGASDCAALLDMGFEAIGRQGCMACVDLIQTFLKQCRRDVVIVADNDPPKKRQDGSVWFPGKDGAIRLAEDIKALTQSVRLIKPPNHKDVRQWFIDGCNKQVIEVLVKNTRTID